MGAYFACIVRFSGQGHNQFAARAGANEIRGILSVDFVGGEKGARALVEMEYIMVYTQGRARHEVGRFWRGEDG